MLVQSKLICPIDPAFEIVTYDTGRRDVAAEAYQKAVDDLKTELSVANDVSTLAGSASNIEDVMKVIHDAKKKYEDGCKEHTGARVWLEKLSGRVMYYSKVFDSLAQHHPEYVALAWGAVKLVLMGIINRATLVEKLAQAFVAIGDVLPRADLNAELYQTDHMRDALSRLYAYIILFLRLCVRWYNRSSLGRLWSALKSPYELDYKELIDQIKVSSAAVEDLASAGARAEIRDIRIIQDLHQARFAELYSKLLEKQEKLETSMIQLMRVATSNKAITEEVKVEVRGISQGVYRLEFHQVVQFLAPTTSPADALRKAQSFARRGTDAALAPQGNIRIIEVLQAWAIADRSSLLIVRTALSAQKQARVLAADVIKRLNSSNDRVFWNLTLPRMLSGEGDCMANVFKSLTHQILKHSADLFAEFAGQLNAVKVLGSHTENEWADLIALLLTKIPNAFVVIETEGLYRENRHDPDWADRFVILLQRILDKTAVAGNRLKILLVVFGTATKISPSSSNDSDVVVASLQSPTPVPPRLRHVARRSCFSERNWKLQTPKV
ncbi:hypothetical protein NX059_001905 [Plenodomus lindquistii]|nr:hypothetical protein NX059_001905 [Plenodomus lindquistii]